MAWATSPVVAERRKLKVENTRSNRIAAIASPPISAASPSRPTTAVSTRPKSGVVRNARVIGTAMPSTMRLLTSKALILGASTGVSVSCMQFVRGWK